MSLPLRALLASAASVCLLTNCTPYQEIDRGESPGDVSAPLPVDDVDAADAGYGTGPQPGAADGGAGQIDAGVAAAYKIRTKADIGPSVDAMMALADRDNDGQLSREEFNIIAPALGQADNSLNPSVEGGPVANPGAGDAMESTTATPIRADDFFAETAGTNGLISRDELTAALTARFDAADADGNGELSAEEAQAFAASMLFSRE